MTLDNSEAINKFMLQITIKKHHSSNIERKKGQNKKRAAFILDYRSGDYNCWIVDNQLASPIHSQANTRNPTGSRVGAILINRNGNQLRTCSEETLKERKHIEALTS